MATTAPMIGASIKRKEDGRFLMGRGRYTDDINLTGQVHAAFVRSPYGCAGIRRVDATAALAMSGVHAVYTGADLKAAGVNPIPPGWLHAGIQIGDRYPMAVDTARFVGEPVAVVVADTPALARDAADAIVVDYDERPAVARGSTALAAGAPQVHANATGNVAFNWQLGDGDATAAAIAGAKTVVRQHLVNQRLIANAIEPRACLAHHDSANDELTLYVTSQNPHVHQIGRAHD